MSTCHRVKLLAALLLVSIGILIFISCGSGAHISLPQSREYTAPPEQLQNVEQNQIPGGGRQERNILSLAMPVLGQLDAGDEFEVTVSGDFYEEVYQGSMRLAFDPAKVKPVGSQPGEMLDSAMVHLTGLDQPEHVPFSFTALPGNAGIEPGTGELVRVRFRLVSQPDGGQPIGFINEAEYLQIRDRQGRRQAFDLETRQGVAE